MVCQSRNCSLHFSSASSRSFGSLGSEESEASDLGGAIGGAYPSPPRSISGASVIRIFFPSPLFSSPLSLTFLLSRLARDKEDRKTLFCRTQATPGDC